MAEVTVVIPNYNSIEHIKECIDSVLVQTMEVDIIVVDNDSTDKSADFVEQNYPEVKLIRLDQNYGFSRAVNEGITRSRTPYVLLLNDDTKCDKELVLNMYKAISASDDIFSASAKMIQYNNRELLDGAGDMYCALGWAFARGKDKKSTRYNKSGDVFACCGGCAIYKKKILDEIGYFDEYHFAYLEDVDMGYRARIMGYRNVYCADAIVYHVGSASSGSRYNDFKVRLSARNNVYMVFKNMPLLQLVINLPFLVIGFGIKGLFFALKGFGRPYFSGIKRGYLLCHEGRHIAYDKRNLGNYVKIQLWLWGGLFLRIADFF